VPTLPEQHGTCNKDDYNVQGYSEHETNTASVPTATWLNFSTERKLEYRNTVTRTILNSSAHLNLLFWIHGTGRDEKTGDWKK